MAILERLRRLSSGWQPAGRTYQRVVAAARPPARIAGRAWRTLSPLGRTLLAAVVLCWVAGWLLGWSELMAIAGAGLVLLVLSAVFVVGPASLRVAIVLQPLRVRPGEPSAGEVKIVNSSSRRAAAVQVDLPVGEGIASFGFAALAGGEAADEVFVVPTERRGVIRVGPATSVRVDPLGLYQREAASSAALELVVHPRTVPLESFGSGLLRDLEGLTTKDLSVSDLAFHALRDYAPGDDRRYVHWRSTAKAGRLLVRQFQDTRRSAVCIVVDGDAAAYGDQDEFETALEIGGSLAARACRDGLAVTVVAADQVATAALPHLLLDAFARAESRVGGAEMAKQIGRVVSRTADVSYGVVVSGSTTTPQQLQAAARRFPAEVHVVVVRVAPGEAPAVRSSGRASLLQLADLSELPALLRAEVAA